MNTTIPRWYGGYRRGFLVCKPQTDDGEVVNVDDDLVAMMSGGDLDGDTKMMDTRP